MTSDLPTGNPTPVAPHGRAMRLLVPLALVALLACPRLPELPADGGLVELPGKKQLSWRVALAKGQALRVRATPEEGDLELRLLDPSGRQVARAQGVRDLGETEELAVVAGRTGTYRVELYDLTALSCRLGVDGPRAAGPADRERVDVAQVTQGLYERLHDGAAEKSRRAAIARVEPVLARWRRLGDLGRAAALLHARGAAWLAENAWETAAADFLAAAQWAAAAGDEVLRADALNDAGRAQRKGARYQEAIALYRQASDLCKTQRQRSLQAVTLSNLAMARRDLGELRAAETLLRESIGIARRIAPEGEPRTFAQVNLCDTLEALGDRQEALKCYELAVGLARRGGHKRAEAAAHNNLGVLYKLLGEWDLALQAYHRALELTRGTVYEVGPLLNIGQLHQRGGLSSSERTYGCQDGEARQDALARGGHLRLAEDCYRRALALAGEDESLRSQALVHQSRLWLRRNAPPKAADLARQALAHAGAHERDKVQARHALGEALYALGKLAAARAELEQALTLSRQSRDLYREAAVSLSLARLERSEGNLAAALDRVDAALALVESERAQVTSPDLRASYLASKQEYSDFRIDTLMELHRREPDAGHAAAALQASERARARSLLDVLSAAGAKPQSGLDPQLLKRGRLVAEKVNRGAWQRRSAPTDDLRQSGDALFEAALEESSRVQAALQASSPRYAALTQAQPLSLAEIQSQVLDPETVLLEYSLGEERSYLWAVTTGGLQVWQLPPRRRIEDAAKRLWDHLTARNRIVDESTREQREKEADAAVMRTAAELSDLVLRPAAAVLQPGRRVVVVADGALQYVPFGVLPAPGRAPGAGGPPLLQGREVVALPSASVLASIRRELRQPPAGALAIFADPVFSPDDERLGERATTRSGSARFPRLRFTAQEASAILGLLGRDDDVLRALEFAATRDAALGSLLAGYQRLHFATHGVLDSQRPDQSSLVLSLVDEQGGDLDGHLRLRDIYDMEIDADLVVLSACDTALGKEVRGEGLIGLTRGFMHAGAARVVASLWKVEERATKELMVLFYQGMLRDGLQPAAALRQAQRQLAEKDGWRSPYYWGAFSLQGEWR